MPALPGVRGYPMEPLVKLRPLLLLLGLLSLLLAPVPARAQPQPPLTIEVQAGYDGTGQYRVGHWFPVVVTVANTGGDSLAVIEWRFPGDADGGFRHLVDLPRGARKRLLLPVVSAEGARRATIVLLVDGVEVARQQVRLEPIAAFQPAVGVISSDPALLNSLRAAQVAADAATAVAHLDPTLLPDDAMQLAGLDTIFIHDLASATLSQAQRDALALWIRLGGQLIVGGGPPAERTVPGLADLLPVEVGQLQAGVPADALARLARRPELAASLPALTASAVTPRAAARTLDQAGLLTAHSEGAGEVIFAAFDLAALRAWAGEASLWEQVMRQAPRATIGFSFRWRSENLLRDTVQFDALRLPSTGVLLLLMLAYIAVVGPANFFVLRRLRRIELAWVTTPLIVVAFLALAYGASFVLRGTRPQVLQLSIVQGFAETSRGQATAFVGLFSPQRRSYQLDFAADSLVTPGTLEGFQFRPVPVTSDGTTTGMRDVLVDVSALRTVIVEQAVDTVPTLASELRRDGDHVRGEVALVAGPALRDVQIVVGAAATMIGDLQPGARATVDLLTTQINFPNQMTLSDEGTFNRNQVLYALFGYDRFSVGGPTFQGAQGHPDPAGLYLIGWAATPTLAVSVDGKPIEPIGETLYVIRLNR